MTRWLLLSYLTITGFVLLVLEIPLGVTFARAERRELVARVQHDAVAIALLSEDMLEGGGPAVDLDALVGRYAADTGGRVVIVRPDGLALADSDSPSARPRSFASRPEVAAALRGDETAGFRWSNTLRTNLLYVAVPVASGGVVHGAVRVTYPASFLDARIRRTWALLGGVGVVVLLVVLGASFVLARSVTRPLRALEDAAVRLGAGELGARAAVPSGPHELAVLAVAFNDTADRLERLVASQRDFVADASHQLRTPLHALRLRLENLEAEAGEVGSEDLHAAVAETERLARLVNGLLALARAEARAAGPAAVDVSRVVEERRGAWVSVAAQRGVDVRSGCPEGVHALATPGDLEQVLDNLLSNAIAASPAGGAVVVSASGDGAWVELHVVDEGPGMRPDERARAFDRFWRAPSSHRDSGSGLGLAIVRRLVQSDGGSVELRDGPAGGLDVAVRLRHAG